MKIVVISGTRADYGILKPVAKYFLSKKCDLSFLISGMHLAHDYGYTVNEIKNDGFDIIGEVDSLFLENTKSNMARTVSNEINGFTNIIKKENPDFVFLSGDRGEMLAASISCLYLGVKTVHFHGGEVSGTVDESIRHAISKLSSIHFTSTINSKRRLERMGEDSWRVFNIGAPRLDEILNISFPDFSLVKQKYKLNIIEKKYALLVFHPVVTEYDDTREQIKTIIKALNLKKQKVLCILPNSDAGSSSIKDVYKDINSNLFEFVVNLHPDDYLSILKNCSYMIGNSSSGIIEAASLSVPVINIGSRQSGREKSKNIIDSSNLLEDIIDSIDKVTSDSFLQGLCADDNIYGDGKSSEKAFKILRKIYETSKNDIKWIQKKITY
ncbi:UDP-N-acetylglucosamine 2-epimerase [Enterococcus casseliflavus]|uniref:UDP-N-acetylglucosamine 2-epimerase n=1 Tax=Enterococcus TaxID=1350 RepID=UPI00115A0F47|nr:UDP-N-acetylglucosamine 2-epimerase [Enterococcus casseliflavus]